MGTPRSLLLISNGHGEDVVGAQLARALHAADPSLRLRAFPTVGEGDAYRGGPAVRVGPLRALPSGGTTMHRGGALARDLRAGLLGMTFAQARDLRAARADAVLTVGDVWAEALGLLPAAGARFAVQTLVSARTEAGGATGLRAFRERFTLPERALLRTAYRRVYLRDEASAASLRARGLAHAAWLGNPMMDGLDAAPLRVPGAGPRIVALPGTRAEAPAALAFLAAALARLPLARVVVPWAPAEVPALAGWRPVEPGGGGAHAWRAGGVVLRLVPAARFAAALAWGEVAVGTAGTAHEQAAGRGLPVVTFPFGAVHVPAFVANQARLLGDALLVVAPEPGAIAGAVARLASDAAERRRRGEVGRARMGGPGGSARIARDVLDRLARDAR